MAPADLSAHAASSPLKRLRALVFEDAAARVALAAVEDTEVFIALAVEIARARGVDLGADDMTPLLRPDPLGLARHMPAGAGGPATPQAGWLPIGVMGDGDLAMVDWAYFGQRHLSEPFFEDSVRGALRLPFNRLFRFRAPLADLARWASALSSLAPSGFIFHMSRCGSTLAAQMLAASPGHAVVSEAAPIDAVVQLDQSPLLAAMIAVFGHRRRADEQRYFIKLDSWHTLALPLFRRAFPNTPWVFLYRDPREVMVSQMRQRGAQMVPQFVPPSRYGLDLPGAVPTEDYCARVLAAVCAPVLEAYQEGGGLLVNYRQLPDALQASILPHFGVAPSDRDHAAMTAAARYNAKTPSMEFSPDSLDKQRAATESIRLVCELRLDDIYRRLEALKF